LFKAFRPFIFKLKRFFINPRCTNKRIHFKRTRNSRQKKDFLSAEEHFDKGLKIAYELYPLAFKKILKILERILFAFKTSQNDLNSIKYLKQALDIQTSEKNDQKMHELNIEIGKKYYNSNDYENADFYLSKSISFYKFPIIQEKALTLKMLSEVNAMLNNNEKALFLFIKE
jgi:Predicted ATPase